VRDYVHVWDLAIAFEKALKLAKPGSTMIELGTGTGHSVLQVVSAVEEVTGRQIKRKHVNPRKEISRLISNPAAAREVLGWEPQYTVLKDIIKSEFDWQKSGNHCIK
jgi:UDP-glucose 4-epimerase